MREVWGTGTLETEGVTASVDEREGKVIDTGTYKREEVAGSLEISVSIETLKLTCLRTPASEDSGLWGFPGSGKEDGHQTDDLAQEGLAQLLR